MDKTKILKYIVFIDMTYFFKNIKPLVRFSATQILSGSTLFMKDQYIVAYDHRIYYCMKGKGVLFINNEKFNLKPGTLVLWKSGLKYRCIPMNEEFTCITANFDYFYK